LLIRFSPDSTHFAAEIIDFIPERRAELLNCLERFNITPAIEFLRTGWFVIHVVVGCKPWMCERLGDTNTSGGIKAEHFLEEVNGCIGSLVFRTGRTRDKDVTLRISVRNVFFERYFPPNG
jgi:hypothetical protein